MKKLQSNFTTPERSKRLLELGVPAWTADCYYTQSGKIEVKNTALDTLYPSCWSVVRLMELYEIVGENAGQCVSTTKSTSRIESLVQLYEENATLLDFSKLEE